MRRRTTSGLLLAALFAAGAGLLPLPLPDFAPLAPVRDLVTSVAQAQYGTSRRVARRTARRTSSRQAAYYDTVEAEPMPVGTPVATSLPPGCTPVTEGGVTYQQCGATRYRAYLQGEQVVYVPE